MADSENRMPRHIVRLLLIFVIGGASIYTQFLDDAKTLLVTIVEGAFTGDTHFPEHNEREWKIISEERHLPDLRNKYPYSFLTLERK